MIMTMYKNTNVLSILLSILLIFSLSTCVSEPNKEVHLTGQLINWSNAQKLLSSDALAADFGLANDYALSTDEEGRFELSFDLDAPTYFSLGRNKLFLQPGDMLNMQVDYKDPEKGFFEGDHSDLQVYLSKVPFPKAGSYLEGGREVKSSSVDSIMKMVKLRNEQRAQELAQIKGPEEFLTLERLRLKLDQINTLLSFPIYGSFKGYWQADEVQKAEVLLPAKAMLNDLSEDIMQDEYMSHPNFRDMLYELTDAHLQDNGIFASLSMTPFMQNYDRFGALVKQLELEGLTAMNKAEMNRYLSADVPEAYKKMGQQKLKEYELLLDGAPAIDLIFADAQGKTRKLSEFKGELIYVDLWATWCGPCIDELPALEKLKEKYKDEEITFIPLSIDSDLDAWQKYLAKNERDLDMEFVMNRSGLAPYKLITIPRYLLFDTDFNIISVFAPKPSDPAVRQLIDQYLGRT